jgi:hypothetical protein
VEAAGYRDVELEAGGAKHACRGRESNESLLRRLIGMTTTLKTIACETTEARLAFQNPERF